MRRDTQRYHRVKLAQRREIPDPKGVGRSRVEQSVQQKLQSMEHALLRGGGAIDYRGASCNQGNAPLPATVTVSLHYKLHNTSSYSPRSNSSQNVSCHERSLHCPTSPSNHKYHRTQSPAVLPAPGTTSEVLRNPANRQTRVLVRICIGHQIQARGRPSAKVHV